MALAIDVDPAPAGAASTDRIGSLDVLRGIALLGMFLVHFNDQSVPGADPGALANLYQKTVALFFEERFWTMFGILFGAGFAVQLRRAEARGSRFAPVYVRRLAALAAVGLVTHAVLGYHVLFEYAVWGLPLLLFRGWSLRALIVALVISASSWSIYASAQAQWRIASIGEPAYRAQVAAESARTQAFRETNLRAQQAPDYRTVFAARLRHMRWFYAQPYSFLPVNTLTLFLIGMIAFRVGLFDRPEEHTRFIAAMMTFGIASWALATWAPIGRGLGLIREAWLAFTYIGAILLLVAHNRVWLRRFRAFGWTGRMALTNYVVQVGILDLLFSKYAFGVTVTPIRALGAGLALFCIDAAATRWWLERFRFGPLEWIWRWVTYARRPELKLPPA